MFGAVYVIKPFDMLVSQSQSKENMRPPDNRPLEDKRFGPPPEHIPGKVPAFPEFERARNVRHFDITSVFIFIMIIGVGMAFESMKQWYQFEQRSVKAEAEKAIAELSFLKAQINPHFLYNTLNNIYTLCITGSENAAESIMKLSNIMRYVTDESEADFVSLQQEIDCISNFIALQRLRLGKKVSLTYTIEGNAAGHRIAPLIFMTYIENVFKYGLSNHLASSIEIFIKIEDQKISLYTQNPLFEFKKPDSRKGVGLENTQKRLDYLYPDQHTVTITSGEDLFTVLLILESK